LPIDIFTPGESFTVNIVDEPHAHCAIGNVETKGNDEENEQYKTESKP